MGLLGAAAISSSPTLADLPKLGSEALRIAWRMGVLVNDISQSIESQELGTEPESWAAVVMNLDENTVQKELDNFNASTVSITDDRTNRVEVLTRTQVQPNTKSTVRQCRYY
jgi:monodictyphenone polyketide synthase